MISNCKSSRAEEGIVSQNMSRAIKYRKATLKPMTSQTKIVIKTWVTLVRRGAYRLVQELPVATIYRELNKHRSGTITGLIQPLRTITGLVGKICRTLAGCVSKIPIVAMSGKQNVFDCLAMAGEKALECETRCRLLWMGDRMLIQHDGSFTAIHSQYELISNPQECSNKVGGTWALAHSIKNCKSHPIVHHC